MSRSLKLSIPGLCLIAPLLLACIGGRTGSSPAQEQAADPAATPAESRPAAAKPAQHGARHTFDLSPRSPAARKIERALDEPRGVDIEFIDQPLKEAMEYLADANGIPIILDEKALQDEGIQTDEPLNDVLSGVTLRSALNIMLEPLGLTYVIDDEVLQITTRPAADEALETRVYDVRPLEKAGFDSSQLARTIVHTIRPKTWPDSAPQQAARSARHGEARAAEPDVEVPAPADKRKDDDSARPDTGLVALDGALVVTHNQDVHRRVVALLDQLGLFAERTARDTSLHDQ